MPQTKLRSKIYAKNLDSWHPNNSFAWGFPQVPSVRKESTVNSDKKPVRYGPFSSALIRKINRKIKSKDYDAEELKYVYNTLSRLSHGN